MKNCKKIILGVAMFVGLAGCFLFFISQKVAADQPGWTVAQVKSFTYTLNQDGTLDLGIDDGRTLTFKPGNSNNSLQVYNQQGTLPELCNSNSLIDVVKSELSNDPAKGSISLYYHNSTVGGQCTNFGAPNSKLPISIDNLYQNGEGFATIKFKDATYLPIGGTPAVYYGKSTNASKCYGGSVIVLDEAGGSTGKVYAINNSPLGSFGSLGTVAPGLPNAQNCGLMDFGQPITIDSKGNANLVVGINDSGGGGTCESNSHIGLEWIFCPAIRGIDGLVTTFYNLVEDQLCVPSGASSTAGGVTCSKDSKGKPINNILTPEVHQAWALLKNIATAILVVIMLIMVISQAFSWGPFDAYTVRKVLPRLVVVAILMQLSWILAKWAIDLSNDLGRGIESLMYAPFPPGVKSINSALQNIGSSGVAIGTGLFVGIAALGWVAGLTVFGVMIMALTAMLGIFVGFLVLFFRKILIILSVIFLPLALAAWILPGTERFWKLWKDNFTKLLMMFPLIVAIIAAGRIFGTIAGSTSHSLLSLLAVLVGFFGPLFVLPKTYQWGGAALGSLGGAMVNSTKAYRRKPMGYAMGKSKDNREQRATLRATRLAEDPNNRRFTDRLFAGEFNLARQRGRGGRLGAREMQFARTLAEGEKASRENVPAQLLRSGYDSWRHGPAVDERGERIREGEAGYEINKLDANQAWLEGRTYAGIAPDAALSGHAFDTLTTLGDPDRLREARESGHVSEEVWSKAVARNFPKLNEIARYLTLAPDLSNLSPRQFTTQDDDTAEELGRQLRGNYVHNRETGGRTNITDPDQQRERLARAANLAVEAHNPLVWSDMSQAKRRVAGDVVAMAREAGIDVDAIAARAGVDPARLLGPPPAPGEAPAPVPEPPEGPGPGEDEPEIRIDH